MGREIGGSLKVAGEAGFGGGKTTYGRSSKKPTVGRLDDPREVALATYRVSLWRVLAGGEEKGSLTPKLKGGSSPKKGRKILARSWGNQRSFRRAKKRGKLGDEGASMIG